ncbi:MAG: ATP-binding protein [Planctomycetota bacterium]
MQTIPKSQVLRRIRVENPWWEPPHQIIPEYRGYRARAYLDLFYPLVESTDVRRAAVLMGPRRVGKTVMLHHAIGRLIDSGVPPRRICYLSVDHPIYNGLRLDELADYCAQASGVDLGVETAYIFFDEIQYLRNWEVHLKALVDERSQLKCTASGSAAAALRFRSSESGAGRFTDFLLPPLTFHEYLLLLDKLDIITHPDPRHGDDCFGCTDIDFLNSSFIDYLNFGGYPEAVLSPTIRADPQRYIKSDIVDKVLLRDLPGLYGISDIQELNYLFTTLAFNTAQEISLEELSKNSGVAKNTIKRYIEYLEAAFLIRIVHRIDRNARRFKRANFFKVYLTNPSIRSALFAPVGPDDEAMGQLTETAVLSQWFHFPGAMHYARWKGGEVDIVHLNSGGVAWAVEVKWSDRYVQRPDDLKSLISFCRANHLPSARVTSRSRFGTAIRSGVHLEFVPASLYCYGVGHNIVEHRRRREGL